MNILMVGLDLNPPWVEGIRNTTYALSAGLARKGHRVHFLTKGYRTHKRTEHLENNITVHRILSKETSGYITGFQNFTFGLPTAITQITKSNKIDIIHSHSSYPAFGSFVNVVASLTRSKKVFTLYSSCSTAPTFEYSPLLRYTLGIAKSKTILKLAPFDAIIVNSKKALNELASMQFLADKLHYVPIGIDTERFRPSVTGELKLRQELHVPEGSKVVLFAGDLTPCKGVESFLFLLKSLRNAGISFVGLILTKGLYEKEHDRRMLVEKLGFNLGLKDGMHFLGIRDDLEVVYGISDVVVFPFLQDYTLMDIPRALLEAMACGKPVIASRVGAIHEVIKQKENGVILEPNDEQAMIDAAAFLLTNNDVAEELGRNAAKCVASDYGLDAMVNQVDRVYNEL
jgi:glycosyltransferase involved in cell wall biosynthesis